MKKYSQYKKELGYVSLKTESGIYEVPEFIWTLVYQQPFALQNNHDMFTPYDVARPAHSKSGKNLSIFELFCETPEDVAALFRNYSTNVSFLLSQESINFLVKNPEKRALLTDADLLITHYIRLNPLASKADVLHGINAGSYEEQLRKFFYQLIGHGNHLPQGLYSGYVELMSPVTFFLVSLHFRLHRKERHTNLPQQLLPLDQCKQFAATMNLNDIPVGFRALLFKLDQMPVPSNATDACSMLASLGSFSNLINQEHRDNCVSWILNNITPFPITPQDLSAVVALVQQSLGKNTLTMITSRCLNPRVCYLYLLLHITYTPLDERLQLEGYGQLLTHRQEWLNFLAEYIQLIPAPYDFLASMIRFSQGKKWLADLQLPAEFCTALMNNAVNKVRLINNSRGAKYYFHLMHLLLAKPELQPWFIQSLNQGQFKLFFKNTDAAGNYGYCFEDSLVITDKSVIQDLYARIESGLNIQQKIRFHILFSKLIEMEPDQLKEINLDIQLLKDVLMPLASSFPKNSFIKRLLSHDYNTTQELFYTSILNKSFVFAEWLLIRGFAPNMDCFAFRLNENISLEDKTIVQTFLARPIVSEALGKAKTNMINEVINTQEATLALVPESIRVLFAHAHLTVFKKLKMLPQGVDEFNYLHQDNKTLANMLIQLFQNIEANHKIQALAVCDQEFMTFLWHLYSWQEGDIAVLNTMKTIIIAARDATPMERSFARAFLVSQDQVQELKQEIAGVSRQLDQLFKLLQSSKSELIPEPIAGSKNHLQFF